VRGSLRMPMRRMLAMLAMLRELVMVLLLGR
jgi:hypothetical protein